MIDELTVGTTYTTPSGWRLTCLDRTGGWDRGVFADEGTTNPTYIHPKSDWKHYMPDPIEPAVLVACEPVETFLLAIPDLRRRQIEVLAGLHGGVVDSAITGAAQKWLDDHPVLVPVTIKLSPNDVNALEAFRRFGTGAETAELETMYSICRSILNAYPLDGDSE